jgi:hypothetical protein
MVFDISGITGPTFWRSERDSLHTAFLRLTSKGWSMSQILDVANDRLGADLLLLDDDGKPWVAVEIKSPGHLLPVERAVALQGASGAREFWLYDGQTVRRLASDRQAWVEMADFPSPSELGAAKTVKRIPRTESGDRSGVEYLADVGELLQRVSRLRETHALVIDHTMPLGFRGGQAADELLASLGSDFPSRRIDFQTALVTRCAVVASVDRIVAFVPGAFLFNPALAGARQRVRQGLKPAGIACLPEGVFAGMSAVQTYIIVLGKYPISASGRTAVARLTSLGQLVEAGSHPWLKDFEVALAGGTTKSTFVVGDDQPWLPAADKTAAKDAISRLAQHSQLVRLGDVCEIRTGFRLPRESSVNGEVLRVIRGRDIANPSVTKDDLWSVRTDQVPPADAVAKPGDVLLRKIGVNPTVLTVTPALEGALIGDTVVLLRPKVQRISADLLQQYLRSTAGQTILSSASTGATIPQLSARALAEAPVPLLPVEVVRDVAEAEKLEGDLRAVTERLSTLRLELYNAESQQDLQARISALRQTARALVESTRQAESLEFQVRNFFPYPLAFAYRTLSSQTIPDRKYKEQLRVGENMLAFLGSLSLALLPTDQQAAAGIDLVTMCRGGVDLGKWRDTTQHATDILSKQSGFVIAREMAAVWHGRSGKRFREAVDCIVKLKTDFKHDRGPTTSSGVDSCSAEMDSALATCYDNLRFLAGYPIRLACEVRPIRGTLAATVVALRYVGDHPGVPQERVEHPRALPVDELYVEVEQGVWYSLFPFVTVHECPTCGSREVYFIDKWNGPRDSAKLKSFERGHTWDGADEGKELAKRSSPRSQNS